MTRPTPPEGAVAHPASPRLSQLSTLWPLIAQAHAGADAGRRAMAALFARYGEAVRQYLVALVGDDRADDLAQEFAFRFVRGDFRHVDPSRGRFRDYVKASALHLVAEHHRRAKRDGAVLAFDSHLLAVVPAAGPDPDELFRRECAALLLDRSWAGLRRHSEETGGLYYEALQLRAARPGGRSAEIADELAARTGKPLTAVGVRQILHRAREKYAELLWREAAESIPSSDPDAVSGELAELGLLAYCEPFVPALRALR